MSSMKRSNNSSQPASKKFKPAPPKHTKKEEDVMQTEFEQDEDSGEQAGVEAKENEQYEVQENEENQDDGKEESDEDDEGDEGDEGDENGEDDEDDENDEDDDDDPEKVEVVFDVLDPEETDWHTVKTLVQNYLDSLPFDSSSLATLILSYKDYVGSVIKTVSTETSSSDSPAVFSSFLSDGSEQLISTTSKTTTKKEQNSQQKNTNQEKKTTVQKREQPPEEEKGNKEVLSEPFAIHTIIPFHNHHGEECIKQICEYFLKQLKSPKTSHLTSTTKMQNILSALIDPNSKGNKDHPKKEAGKQIEKTTVGLLINQKLVNVPSFLCRPQLEIFFQHLQWAREYDLEQKEPTKLWNFDYFLVATPVYVPSQSKSENSGSMTSTKKGGLSSLSSNPLTTLSKSKKSKNQGPSSTSSTKSAELDYVFPEDEVFHRYAVESALWVLPGRPPLAFTEAPKQNSKRKNNKSKNQDGNDDDDDDDQTRSEQVARSLSMVKSRLIMLVPVSKSSQILADIQQLVTSDPQ